MTTEARIGFLLFFFLVWVVVGLAPWAISAVANKGRGAEWTLPVAIGGACACGVRYSITREAMEAFVAQR